jgi:hypothetical protein
MSQVNFLATSHVFLADVRNLWKLEELPTPIKKTDVMRHKQFPPILNEVI